MRKTFIELLENEIKEKVIKVRVKEYGGISVRCNKVMLETASGNFTTVMWDNPRATEEENAKELAKLYLGAKENPKSDKGIYTVKK